MTVAMDNAVLGMLGRAEFDHAPTWTAAKPPSPSATVVGHLRQLGSKDVELVNAYGIDAVEITCRADSFPQAPIKFDHIVVKGHSYIAQDVRMQVGFSGAPILYRIYAKGR
jgi:hypothetical protein